MRSKKPLVNITSHGKKRRSGADGKYMLVERELRCSRCKAVFPDFLARCPECGSEEWVSLEEVNPYTKMPLETFLKACGHLFWLMGVAAFLVLLWQTDSSSDDKNAMFVYGAISSLVVGVLASAAYFGISETLRRLLRMQRRLQVFHESYVPTSHPHHAHVHRRMHTLHVASTHSHTVKVPRVTKTSTK